MSGEYFESAEVSDIGRKRKNNEDACLQIAAHGIFCVADGMGGQMGGDIASETIVTTLQEVFGKITPEEDNTLPKRVAIFRAATNRASKWIKDFADEKVVGQMGSTIVALVIDPRDPRRAVGLHAGDSRLYRYRNGELKQITSDHSAVTALAAKLGIPPEQVPAKYQNELLRAVGLSASVELEKTPVDVSTGDIFLICSDGLTKMLSDANITKMIKDGLQSGVQSLAQALINAANEAGGKDNVTVILIKALDLSTAPRLAAPDDDDKTPIPPSDIVAQISPPTPVPAKDTPHGFESDEIKGDTPQTPITKDLTGQTPPEKKTPSKKLDDPVTPALHEETQTHFITRPKPGPKKKTSSGTDIDREAPTPSGKGLPIIIAFAVILAGTGIWLAVKSKSSSHPAAVATAPATNSATVARASPPPSASPSPPPSTTANPNQQAYDDAMKNAQAAWGRGDYKDAASLAAAALQKIPGDAAATKLAGDAQAQLKAEDSWRTALLNGRSAFSNGDYKNAVAWANEALKYIPREKAASQLRDDAQQKLSTAAADEEKYQTALREGEAALKNDDLSTADTKAQEMLVIRPNDAKAQEIIKQSGQMMDYESAQHAFDESDYDYALQICQNYSTADSFQKLAQKCRAEQASLNDDKSRLAAGDYSFVNDVQSQGLAKKGAFAGLLAQAAREQKILDQLQAFQKAGNWQAVARTLADAGNGTLTSKAPFRALNQWVKSRQNQIQLKQATTTFEEMLVWFNIKRPNDPYIQSAEARQQVRYDGALDDKQRQQYLGTIAQLQTVFASTGMLDQNDRAKLLKNLEDTIAHHE
ncbi:MAG TPA: protein phosphatase 2C domain-containing protein [Candidatus Acidoferrum sp.]|nr:protein phosphatase 2C domain-containing protein [Candidatus Acidoferrum sp.]